MNIKSKISKLLFFIYIIFLNFLYPTFSSQAVTIPPASEHAIGTSYSEPIAKITFPIACFSSIFALAFISLFIACLTSKQRNKKSMITYFILFLVSFTIFIISLYIAGTHSYIYV